MQALNKKRKRRTKYINHLDSIKTPDKIEKKDSEQKLQIFLSNEEYERTSIFDFTKIAPYYKKFDDISLFERKKVVKNFFLKQNNQYTLDELLSLDDTNRELWILFANKNVEFLNKEKDKEIKNIFIEKIKKSQIILDEINYKEIIGKISDAKIKDDLAYINYKLTLINSLQCILENKDVNANEKAKEALKISKKFKFNQWPEIGETNLYFYKISTQLFDKIDEIFYYFVFYENVLRDMINFLKNENFDKLDKDKIFLFNYISYIVLDKNTITSDEEYAKINNFLSGKKVKTNDLEKLFENGLTYKKKRLKGITINIEYDKETKNLSVVKTEDRRINRKNYKYSLIKSYNTDLFNENILKLIKNCEPNFESLLMENTLPCYDSQLAYYEEILPSFNKNLKKILKSDAARKFFENTYKKKYPDLTYHFDREDVLDEIMKNIMFFPIYKINDFGFTNPVDMSIIINSIPGIIGNPETHAFNIKFLNLGMILLIALHEIFGHYMRRYYSLLSGGIITFDTPEDNNDGLTGKESGFYIESNFLGIDAGKSNIGLKKCLMFLYSDNFKNYPIFTKEDVSINFVTLKNIYNNNKELFDFIIDTNEDNDDGNGNIIEINDDEDNSNNKIILLEDYLDTLTDIKDYEKKFRHCRQDELYYIYFDKRYKYIDY